MAVQSSTKINLGKVEEVRGAGTAGGTALSSTAAYAQFPPRTNRFIATPRNFSTAVVVRYSLNSWLTVLKTTDSMATTPLDYSVYAQDNSASTDVDLSDLDTVANGDFVLLGSHTKFRGAYLVVDAANGTGSCTGLMSYWTGTWTDLSATMSGVTSGTFLDQTGLIYWSVPAIWNKQTLNKIYTTTPFSKAAYYADVPLYWVRMETNLQIDSTVTLDSMSLANRSTVYAEIVEGQAISGDIQYGFGGTGCLECLVNTGTANLVITAITRGIFD